MNNIKIIGLGGIGSELCEQISRFLTFSSSNQSTITLIDGDNYETKNRERQNFSDFGNKAIIKCRDLRDKFPFSNLNIKYVNQFVNSDNIKNIIENGDIVFLAVDNHKTRKLVSDFSDSLKDITIISGGNELTDGNIQIYIRKGGEKLTPNLTDFHPEIKDPVDKLPEEMSCEELHSVEPQLLFTNVGVSTFMCWAFFNILKGNPVPSEVYFDIKSMNSDSKNRKVKN